MPSHATLEISRSASYGTIRSRLFRNTILGVEAVGKLLAVLVRGVFGEQLTVRGALEGLEARLALDGLGCGVLRMISICACLKVASLWLIEKMWESYGLQLRLGFLGTGIALAVALLLCSTVSLVEPHFFYCRTPYFAPLPMLLVVED